MLDSTPNNSSSSTTFAFRRVKISTAPQAGTDSRRRRPHFKGLKRRNPRDPLQVTIVFRGGAECWWELRARGAVLRRPGHNSLHDVLWELQGSS